MKAMKALRALVTIGVVTLAQATPVAAQTTFIVNSNGDAGDSDTADGICDDGTGACTLRAALEQANASAGADRIEFTISGTGPHTIQPASALPIISDPVIIDGYTQPGAAPATTR